jgi:integrase
MAGPHLFALNPRAGRRGSGPGYNRRMTTTPAAPSALIAELEGLTPTDTDRIAQAIAATYAPTTLHAYAWAWRHFTAWCAGRDLVPLPATPAAVCAYLTERAAQGVAFGTLSLASCAIAFEHRRAGAVDPTADEAVGQVRRGLRRSLGTAPIRQARPLSVAEIRQIVGRIERETPQGARDAALILLGFASALRRSELAALTLADIETNSAGLLLTIRRSKTDPDRRGQFVGVAHGRHRSTDPVAALADWLAARGTAPGPVFTSMRPGGPTLRPISGNAIARILRDRAGATGLPTTRITGHSLRAGHATSAALAGVGVERIAAQTRHKRIDVLIERYIRPMEALRTTSSRDLGL